MDPFSVIVGVAGLLGLVAKTIELTRSYVHGSKSARKAAEELSHMLQTLQSILSQLDKHLKNDTSNAFSNTSVLVTSTNACRVKLLMVHTKLTESAKQPTRLMRWPLNDDDHQQTVKDLRSFVQWIQFGLTIDGSILMSRTSEEVVQVLSNQLGLFERLSELKLGADSTHDVLTHTHEVVVKYQTAMERREVLEWVSKVKHEDKHQEIRLPRLDGTGQWLLEDTTFQDWRVQSSKPPNVLWCHGIPGSGKSILASLVVDYLRDMAPIDPAIVAYVYFDYRDRENQSVEQIVASILQQVAGSQPTLPTAVVNLYDLFGKRGKTANLQDLTQALVSVARDQPKVFLVIDALDECDVNLRREFLNVLGSLTDNISMFVTGRSHVQDVVRAFGNTPSIEIKAHRSDLWSCITHEIQASDWQDDLDERYRNDVADKIINNAEDMFLLAVLHVRTVLVQPTIGQMMEVLDHLPRNLHSAFEETMQRIRGQPEALGQLGLNCLMWVSHVRRPMSFDELGDALAITTQSESNSLDSTFRPSQRRTTNACHGLITVDEKTKIVHLVHYSVYEYLRRSEPLVFPKAEEILARLCIRYQLFESFNTGCCYSEEKIIERLKEYPLLAYAARNWGTHVANSVNAGVDQLALEFLQAREPLACSQQVWQYTRGRREEYWEPEEVRSCNALHVSSMFGLNSIARGLLASYDIDTPTGLGTTALMKAASCGFPDLVRLFMSKNADPTRQNWYGTALHVACEAGQIGSIEALLDAGVDVNSPDSHGRLPLTCAVEEEHIDAMRTLLERGADVNFADAEGATPLFLAVQSGARPEIVRILLEHDADPNTMIQSGDVAIHFAAFYDDDDGKIARMLLDHGAKIDALNTHERTVVHIAAARGHTKQLAFYLDLGVAIDAQDKVRATALHLASRYGKTDSVRLLLARGARSELGDASGRTALRIATVQGHTEIIQLLLDAGANAHTGTEPRITTEELSKAFGELAKSADLMQRLKRDQLRSIEK
ncbi:MAG: hypothetical protein Q9207_007148 [Kuettlingeria erythrocarpa]